MRISISDREDIRSELRARDIRATPARVAVLAVMRAAGRAMSHNEVAERLDGGGWDRATVYRNLVSLTEAGLLRRTDVGDHVWRFELAEADEHEAVHPHFLCTECGTVTCLPTLSLQGSRETGLPRSVRDRQVEIQLKGLCDSCR